MGAGRDVDAELTSVATIEPVSQAPVAFPAGGTVATVDVAVGVGDTVAVGQELASLDTAQLTRALNQQKEALAQAELALSRALDGESTSDAPTIQPAASSSTTSADVELLATSQQPSGGGTDTQLAALQQAVIDAQAAVDQAIAAANATMDTATTPVLRCVPGGRIGRTDIRRSGDLCLPRRARAGPTSTGSHRNCAAAARRLSGGRNPRTSAGCSGRGSNSRPAD